MALRVDIGTMVASAPGIKSGAPHLAGTGVTVRSVARWHQAGLMPEEIVLKFSGVKLEQVHAALAYYFANQQEIDADIRDQEAKADEIEERAARHLRR